MANSLRGKIKKLRHEMKISEKEYAEIMKKLDGHDAELLAFKKEVVCTRWKLHDVYCSQSYECMNCGSLFVYEDNASFDEWQYCPRCGSFVGDKPKQGFVFFKMGDDRK